MGEYTTGMCGKEDIVLHHFDIKINMNSTTCGYLSKSHRCERERMGSNKPEIFVASRSFLNLQH